MKPATLACALAFSTLCGSLPAQPPPPIEFPAASPSCTLKQRVGLTDIEVTYSRPGVKGRTIFGGLVAYGQVWRTGANQATRISFSTPVKFAGADVPAGSYELFSIPGEDKWTVILNKASNQWGAYQYNSNSDLVRVPATPVHIPQHIETFAIEFNHVEDESALLELVWDDVVVPIRIDVDVTATLLPKIEARMASPDKKDDGFLFQAATFYYNHDLDLKKALGWVNAALMDDPRIAFEILHLKAQILAKQGDKDGAIAAANLSTEKAKTQDGPNSGFIRMNNDLINSLK
jgi:hypothetical protein